MFTSYKKFIKKTDTVPLQRKLLFSVVMMLSLILVISNVIIYKLVSNTFVEAEENHVQVIAETLSKKVSVLYFISDKTDNSRINDLFQKAVADYKLEYLCFKDESGLVISKLKLPQYTQDNSYNVKYKIDVYSPEDTNTKKNIMGTLELGYTNNMLKELMHKYIITAIIFVVLLIFYFYLEMRLLKELLMPLNKIAIKIKNYKPGDKLIFKKYNSNSKEDVIHQITSGFIQMQKNIDDAMRDREIEEEKARAKDAFLVKQSRFIEMGTMISNIAHQWKQPLNIIEISISDLTIKDMLGETDSNYQKKVYDNIHNQVAFMSRTIDIFKNFLSDDSSKKNLEIFSIKKAVTESLQLLNSILDNNDVIIETNLCEESFAYGSISEMEQALLVLINNAADAITNNNIENPKIKIECSKQDDKNIINIYDNGGGFDSNIIDKIFDAYFTTKHPTQGTGLGLFITKTIIELKFKGTIEATNYKDGALFVIKLPLAKSEE